MKNLKEEHLTNLASELEKKLKKIKNKRLGFCLIIFEQKSDEKVVSHYVANMKKNWVLNQLQSIINSCSTSIH